MKLFLFLLGIAAFAETQYAPIHHQDYLFYLNGEFKPANIVQGLKKVISFKIDEEDYFLSVVKTSSSGYFINIKNQNGDTTLYPLSLTQYGISFQLDDPIKHEKVNSFFQKSPYLESEVRKFFSEGKCSNLINLYQEISSLPLARFALKKEIAKNEYSEESFPFTPLQFNNPLCQERYAQANKILDKSMADVLVNHPYAMAYAKEMNKRLFQFIESDALIELKSSGVINPSQIQIDKKVDTILKDNYGGCNPTNAGCVGNNPKDIRNVFNFGNLRERMYLLYKPTWIYLDKIFRSSKIDSINNILRDRGTNLNLNLIKKNRSIDNHFHEGPFTKYYYHVNHKNASPLGKKYSSLSGQSKEQFLLSVAKNRSLLRKNAMEHRRIPLSQREINLLPSNQDYDTYDHFISGEDYFTPPTNAPSRFVARANNLSLPLMAGVSGSLDRLLTLGLYFGLDSVEEVKMGAISGMAWMLDAGDHSLSELLLVTKNFGLPYTMKSNQYEDILKDDPNFLINLRAAQARRGHKLPQDILRECL